MIFKVKTTEFAMIPVTEGGYLSFMIGETEVTKGLYNALTDSVIIKSDYPQTFATYNSCIALCDSLKKNLGMNFSLPTETQWEWAYKGGEKSLGYKFCGSDIASEIGWDKTNSGGMSHKVATLMPNELGIYDMYGNLGEWYEKSGSSIYYQKSCFSETSKSRYSVSYATTTIKNVGVRLCIAFK